MNKDDLMKKGLIQEKKEEMERLRVEIDACIKQINNSLFMYDGVESIEERIAQQRMEELVKAKEKYKIVKAQLRELEK